MLEYTAKLIATDGFEERKLFDTQTAALKWISGEGAASFDGDLLRTEIHHKSEGLKWVHCPWPETDAFYRRLINRSGHTGKQMFRKDRKP